MSNFARFVCWDAVGTASLITTEAVSPSLPVFMATHAPLRIFRARMDGAHTEYQGQPVDEEAVRRDFLTRKIANGALLMPVVGASGTGKSHLVRWVKEQTPSDDRRHVIYLPKLRTSLKAVVSALLEQAEGDQFEALRADVERVISQVDEIGLQNRLLNQLQEAVAATPPPDGPARILVRPDGLPALLLDPHVRLHLLQPHRLIPQFVANLLADRQEDQPERPWNFTVDDLPTTIENPDHASRQAQRLLQMVANRPDLQVAAVDLLNETLDAAAMNATVGVGRLQGALLEIRRLFAQQGKEIILLIEDFALIQGVQRDLLEAVIETGVRDGRATLAPIRTLMAVTPGYLLQIGKTVLTRVQAATPHVYDLGRQFDDSDEGRARLLSFVGRYLNAARLGRERLDDLTVRSHSDVPNACDGCKMLSTCHAAFGTTEQGHGLYPFNQPSLIRAIHSRAPGANPSAVNPRNVLGEVVRNVLVEHVTALRDGRFPDAQFREEYLTSSIDKPLPGRVQRAVENLDPADAARRALTLEFWGDAPTEICNLAPEIHTAFALPILANITPSSPALPAPEANPATAKSSPTSPLSPSTQKAISDVEQWLTRNVALDQGTANEIRRIISETVLRRYQWVSPIMAPQGADVKRVWASKSTTVSIEGAAAENNPATKHAPIKLKRNPSNSEFLKGLLVADVGQIPGNAEHVRRLYALAENHCASLVQRVRQSLGTEDTQLVLGLRASLLGAVLGGRAVPTMSEASLINAVLDDGKTWDLQDKRLRSADWIAALNRHLERRPELVRVLRQAFGFRRGTTGAVRLIDIAHLLPLLRQASGDWDWTAEYASEAPDWVKTTGARGLGQVSALIGRQAELVRDRVQRLRYLIPKGTRGRDAVRAVRDALQAGISIGQAPSNKEEFTQVLTAAENIDWTAIERLERRLEAWLASDEQTRPSAALLLTGQDNGPALSEAVDVMALADTWLTGALTAIAGRVSVAVSGTDIEEVLGEWKGIRDS